MKSSENGRKTLFSSTNQPKKNGRKPNRYKELLAKLGYSDEDRTKVSNEDLHKVLERILMSTKEELSDIIQNKETPIVAITLINALREDINIGTFKAVEYLLNRVYGTAKQIAEVTVSQERIIKGLSKQQISEILADEE